MQCNMFDTFIRLYSPPPLLGCGDVTSQNQSKGEECKKFFKMGCCVKKMESSQKVVGARNV